MGYTHYWTQKKDHTKKEWAEIAKDVGLILDHIQTKHGVKLAKDYDEPDSAPLIDGDVIWFNGVGDAGHETFVVHRTRPPLEDWQKRATVSRGWSFCKTAEKPYDIAVVAVLCYLTSVSQTFTASSDGEPADWQAGLEAVREALPRYANVLNIPQGVREDA